MHALKRLLGPLLIFALLAGGNVSTLSSSARQSSNPIDFNASMTTIAQLPIDATSSSVALSLGRFTIGQGQASIEFIARGTIAVTVMDGRLTLLTDQSIAGAGLAGDGTTIMVLSESTVISTSDGTGLDPMLGPDWLSSGSVHIVDVESGLTAVLLEGTHVRFVAGGQDHVIILLMNVSPQAHRVGRARS